MKQQLKQKGGKTSSSEASQQTPDERKKEIGLIRGVRTLLRKWSSVGRGCEHPKGVGGERHSPPTTT